MFYIIPEISAEVTCVVLIVALVGGSKTQTDKKYHQLLIERF